jgi:phosphatidylserine/phosphatidylglycerophosphate/cardiolipin synthase-like enzyme
VLRWDIGAIKSIVPRVDAVHDDQVDATQADSYQARRASSDRSVASPEDRHHRRCAGVDGGAASARHAPAVRMYHPYTKDGAAIYYHAKILIADDDVFRLGSSNVNNRSLRLDTECDLAVRAKDAATSEVIAAIRDGVVDGDYRAVAAGAGRRE